MTFNHWGMMYYGWGGVFMGLLLLILIGVVLYLVAQSSRSKDFTRGDSALDVLKKRYAKGEITKEQFEQMKKDLK